MPQYHVTDEDRRGGYGRGRKRFWLAAKISWGEGLATAGIPKAPNCIMHTLACRPMLCSEAERFAHQMASESTIASQHLKEPAVPNDCPKHYGPRECSAVGIFTAWPTPPNFATRKFSLKTKISHKLSSAEIVPPPGHTEADAMPNHAAPTRCCIQPPPIPRLPFGAPAEAIPRRGHVGWGCRRVMPHCRSRCQSHCQARCQFRRQSRCQPLPPPARPPQCLLSVPLLGA